MTPSIFGRIFSPIAEENDVDAKCEAEVLFLEPEGAIVVVYVIEKTESTPDKSLFDAGRKQADAIFIIVQEQSTETSHDVQTELRFGTAVVDEILHVAEEFDASSICFAPRLGSRWIKLLSGDHAYWLTTETELLVLVFPHPEKKASAIPDAADAGHRVLAPIDGSEQSWKAVVPACSVYPESDVTVLHILESTITDVYNSMTSALSTDFNTNERRKRRKASWLLKGVQEIADEHDVDLPTVTLTGNVANTIGICVEESDVDLIAMASRGRASLKQNLLRGITESTIHRSPATVVR